jgi:hypothetical protein
LKLYDEDKHRIVRMLPAHVKACMTHAPHIILAGGFLRAIVAREDASDIDLFIPKREMAQPLANQLRDEWASRQPAQLKNAAMQGVQFWHSDNAITVKGAGKLPIQIIHRWTYDTPAEVVKSFDYTIASAAMYFSKYDANQGRPLYDTICDDRFYADLAAKRLRYLSPERNEDAGGSTIRLLKFYQRGYRIPLESLAAVIARLVKGVPVDILGSGDESSITQEIRKLLFEVDPNADPAQAEGHE